MKLTKKDTVLEELNDIPQRGWWKVSFSAPAVLFLVLGGIDFFVSDDHRTQILLVGLILGSNLLATSYLKNRTYKIIAQLSSLIFALIFISQSYFMAQ